MRLFRSFTMCIPFQYALESHMLIFSLFIERNHFPAKNRTLSSYRIYISPTKQASPPLIQISTQNANIFLSKTFPKLISFMT